MKIIVIVLVLLVLFFCLMLAIAHQGFSDTNYDIEELVETLYYSGPGIPKDQLLAYKFLAANKLASAKTVSIDPLLTKMAKIFGELGDSKISNFGMNKIESLPIETQLGIQLSFEVIRSIGSDAVPILMKHLRTSDGLNIPASISLASMGKTVIPTLIKALQDERTEERWQIVLVLGLMGTQAKEAVPYILQYQKSLPSIDKDPMAIIANLACFDALNKIDQSALKSVAPFSNIMPNDRNIGGQSKTESSFNKSSENQSTIAKVDNGAITWQNDIKTFQKTLASIVDEIKPTKQNENLEAIFSLFDKAVAMFKGKEVTWDITFLGIDEDGNVKIEESPLSHRKSSFLGETNEFIGIYIKPDSNAIAEWNRLKLNQRVKCCAQITKILAATRLDRNQEFIGWAPLVFLEKATFTNMESMEQKRESVVIDQSALKSADPFSNTMPNDRNVGGQSKTESGFNKSSTNMESMKQKRESVAKETGIRFVNLFAYLGIVLGTVIYIIYLMRHE